MTSLKLRIAVGLLFILAAHGCSGSAPAEPPAATVEAELAKPTPAAEPVAPATPEPAAAPTEPAPPKPAELPVAAQAALCDDLCTRTASLKCGPAEACKTSCEDMNKSDMCRAELQAMLKCVAAKPVSAFACDPTTKAPALRDGQCGAERGAVAECLSGGGM